MKIKFKTSEECLAALERVVKDTREDPEKYEYLFIPMVRNDGSDHGYIGYVRLVNGMKQLISIDDICRCIKEYVNRGCIYW